MTALNCLELLKMLYFSQIDVRGEMMNPELPNIVETPNHFFYGSVDLISAIGTKTKIKQLENGFVEVTKTFIAKDYQYKNNDSLYNLRK